MESISIGSITHLYEAEIKIYEFLSISHEEIEHQTSSLVEQIHTKLELGRWMRSSGLLDTQLIC